MRLSVAICTWNRAASLDRTLASLAAADPPVAAIVEVLVVDNRCTDNTPPVVERYLDRLSLRRLYEPRPGLSHARNTAVEAATGDYLLWTDDDVVVDRGWLRGYEAAVAEHPAASFFGGPIEPVFEGGQPEWIRRGWPLVASTYAERKFGDTPFRFERGRLPFGANLMVRMSEMRTHRFDPQLGRRPVRTGQPLVGGDETVLLRRLLETGHEGWWVPTSRVRHCIPVERQTLRYIRSYFEGQGVAQAIVRQSPVDHPSWRHALRLELRYRWCRATGSVEAWLPALIEAATAAGLRQQTQA